MTVAERTKQTAEDAAAARFPTDIAEHVLEVLHDDGVHRRIRLAKPGTGHMGVEVVTWPGHVAVTGDMGSCILSRERDMLAWAAHAGRARPDFRYWEEKTVANDGPTMKFSRTVLEQHLRDAWREHCENEGVDLGSDEARDWWKTLDEDILCAADEEIGWRDALNRFEGRRDSGVNLSDTWEWDCREYDYAFAWRMLALRHVANLWAQRQSEIAA